MFRGIILFLSLILCKCICAGNNNFLNNEYRYMYNKCEVKFANVRSCLKIAEAIYLNSLYRPVDEGVCVGPGMSFWQSESVRTIDKNKYMSEDMVRFCKEYPDLILDLSNYTYYCSFQDKKIKLGDIPFMYEGVTDTLQDFLCRPLEQFMIKICQDTSLMRFNSFIETYMEHCAEVTPKLFNWIDSKSKTKFDYLCANFSPFDSEGMTSYCNSDTLFILGNSIYETDHVDCHKSEKTFYYIFTSIASGFFYSLMTPRYNEELCYALSDALYFEYLEETKSDIKDVEKESVRCLYRKYNYRIGEKSFDEFVSDFHSLYKKKKYRNNLEKLCVKILDDYNKVK